MSVSKNPIAALDKVIGSALRISGLRHHASSKSKRRLGGSPGIERAPDVDVPPAPGLVAIHCLDFGPDRMEATRVDDLEAYLAAPRPDWVEVRWLDVIGLHPFTINRLRERYQFHTLAAEDILHVPQRSKLEPYEDHLFVVAHMLTMDGERLCDEQVSFIYFPDLLLTFQQTAGDVWDPVRKRLENPESRLRRRPAGYLLYALVDAVVDHYFPILERYGDLLEAVEARIAVNARPSDLRALYGIKRELGMLRRVIWPTRQLADELVRIEGHGIDKSTKAFLRDVYDHATHAIEIVETYREMASGLTDLYMSSISNRMNEVMKVLTIMASLFIPITFLAGVYGMNFEHIPELRWAWSYPIFWAICVVSTVSLLLYFRHKGWLGGGDQPDPDQ